MNTRSTCISGMNTELYRDKKRVAKLENTIREIKTKIEEEA